MADTDAFLMSDPDGFGQTLTRTLREMTIHRHNQPRQHYSQFGQDMLIGDVLFRGREGVFVDVGARDGKVLSNTLYLESLGWTGIAIEPHPDFYAELQQLRSCRTVNVAAGRETGEL